MANQTLENVFLDFLGSIFLSDDNCNRRKFLLTAVLFVCLFKIRNRFIWRKTYSIDRVWAVSEGKRLASVLITMNTLVLCSYLFMPWLFPESDLVHSVLSANIIFLSLTYTNLSHVFIFKKQAPGRLL